MIGLFENGQNECTDAQISGHSVGQADGAGVVGPLDLGCQAHHGHVVGEVGPVVVRVDEDLVDLRQ